MKQLKRIVLSALILTAASMAHAAGQTTGGFDGFASASVGYGSNEPNSGIDNSGLATDAQLALSYTDKSGFGGQLDLGYFKQNYDDSNVDLSFREAATHLYYRSQSWLVGTFAQQRKYYTNGNSNNVKGNFLGLEGQVYLNNMTLYGQLGQGKWKYSTGSTDPDVMATLELRYFMNENLRLDASINYLKEDAAGLSNYVWDQKTYGVGAEYLFSGSPLSMLARYEYADENQNTGYTASNQRLLIGVKLNFGKDTLRKSDREGASLKPISKDLIWGVI